jgi:hypothetical protein
VRAKQFLFHGYHSFRLIFLLTLRDCNFQWEFRSRARSTSHRGSLLSTTKWIWDRHVSLADNFMLLAQGWVDPRIYFSCSWGWN